MKQFNAPKMPNGAAAGGIGKPAKPPQAQTALPPQAQAAIAQWQARNAGKQPIRTPFAGPTTAGSGRIQYQQEEAARQQTAAQLAARNALAAKMAAAQQLQQSTAGNWWNEPTGGA